MSGNEYDANRSNKRSEEEIVCGAAADWHAYSGVLCHPPAVGFQSSSQCPSYSRTRSCKASACGAGLTLKLFRDSVSLVWGSLVKALALLLPQPAPQARCLRCAAPQVRVAPSLQASASATPENATPAK